MTDRESTQPASFGSACSTIWGAVRKNVISDRFSTNCYLCAHL